MTKLVLDFEFQNVTSSPQYSTFLEHIIPRFLTFLQDGEVQFLQEKPTQVCGQRLRFGLFPTLTNVSVFINDIQLHRQESSVAEILI